MFSLLAYEEQVSSSISSLAIGSSIWFCLFYGCLMVFKFDWFAANFSISAKVGSTQVIWLVVFFLTESPCFSAWSVRGKVKLSWLGLTVGKSWLGDHRASVSKRCDSCEHTWRIHRGRSSLGPAHWTREGSSDRRLSRRRECHLCPQEPRLSWAWRTCTPEQPHW